MARTRDDAHRTDALAGALARQHDLNRGVNVLFWDEFIEKRDPDEQFTASDTLSLRRAAGSVSVDIFLSARKQSNALSSLINCTSVARIVYPVPLVVGLEVSTLFLNWGFSESLQQAGAVKPFLASRSRL